MLNRDGSSAPRCAGIPQQDSAEFTKELQECIKEQIIPTPIVPLFERARTMVLPLVSAHKVEKKTNHICISKEKVKVCGGLSVASSPDMMKTKTVQYACVSSPSSKAKSLEQRAKAGESLGIELGALSTAYTKEEAEPSYCGTEGTGGMEMGGRSGYEIYRTSGTPGGAMYSGYGSGSRGNQGGYGMGASGSNGFGPSSQQISSGSGASPLPSRCPDDMDDWIRPLSVDFEFERTSRTEKSLDDGNGNIDVIRMDKTCNVPGLSRGYVRLQISEPKTALSTGWKAIQKSRPNKYICDHPQTVVSVNPEDNPSKTEASIDIPHADLDDDNVKWALGKHDGVVDTIPRRPTYLIEDAYKMKAGCAYTFTWLRDS